MLQWKAANLKKEQVMRMKEQANCVNLMRDKLIFYIPFLDQIIPYKLSKPSNNPSQKKKQ